MNLIKWSCSITNASNSYYCKFCTCIYNSGNPHAINVSINLVLVILFYFVFIIHCIFLTRLELFYYDQSLEFLLCSTFIMRIAVMNEVSPLLAWTSTLFGDLITCQLAISNI